MSHHTILGDCPNIWWFKREYQEIVKRALAQRAEYLLIKEEKTKEKTGKNHQHLSMEMQEQQMVAWLPDLPFIDIGRCYH